jgi:hypothetical protein
MFARWLLPKAVKKGVEVITSVKPGTKTGGKTVQEWKSAITNKKSQAISTAYHDEIRRAGAKLTGKVNQTAKNLQKLNETLKKQKKILDD